MNYVYMAALIAVCVMSPRALHGMDKSEVQQISSKKKRTFMQDVLDGAFAGGVEVMVNNPLVVMKNDLILRKDGSGTGTTILNSLKGYSIEPRSMIKKYYKGCGAGVASMAPITALQNSIAFILTKAFGDNPTLTQKTVAACGAGWLAALLASPADLVVLQRQNPIYAQEHLSGTLRRIYGVNGLATVYRGLNGTGVRDGIFTAAYKTGGNVIQSMIPTITGNPGTDMVLCATLAGLVAAILSHPADVIAARMKSDLSASYYKTTLQTATTLVKEEGAKALFKGLTPRTFRILFAIPLINAILEREVGTKITKKIVG